MSILIVAIKIDKLYKEDTDLINSLLTNAGIKEWKLVNVKYYQVPLVDDKLKPIKYYLAIGPISNLISLNKAVDSKVVEIVSLDKLSNKPENEQVRMSAFIKVKALAEEINTPKIVFSIDKYLTTITEEYIFNLQKRFEEEKIEYVIGLNDEEQIVCIVSNNKIKIKEKVNFVITITELLTLKLAKEILGLNNIKVEKEKENGI